MANKIQFKRGVKANLPTLNLAEPAFTTDTNELFVGNGTTNIKLAKQTDLDTASNKIGDLTANGITEANLALAIKNDRASLSDKANNTDANRTTTSKDVTGAINELNSNKAPISSPNFTGTPMISSKNIATFETISLPTLLNGWNKIIGDMNNSCVRVGNVITINASIGGGNSADGTVVFNLPLGFRAGTNILQPAYNWANRETAFVTVRNNGDVTVRAGINSTDTFILSFSFLGA